MEFFIMKNYAYAVCFGAVMCGEVWLGKVRNFMLSSHLFGKKVLMRYC